MKECNFRSYGAWWYCSKDGIALKEEERPFQLEINAISRSIRKGYEQLKNKSVGEMALAVKGQAINGANDLIENTGLGLNRLSDAWIHSKLAPTTGRNPIFDRDAEAIHLLSYAKNPSELIEITASIVFNYIYQHLDDKQKNDLNNLFSATENTLNKNHGMVIVNEYAYYKALNETPSMVENTGIRKTIVSVLIYLIARRAFFRLNIFKRKWNAKIKPKLSKGYWDIALMAISTYGIIEKLDKASKRLRVISPMLYNKLDEEKLSLTYLFLEDDISPILKIIENKGLHDSYDLLQAFRNLINTTN